MSDDSNDLNDVDGAQPESQKSLYAMIPVAARVAVYDSIASEPRVVEIAPAPARDYIESLATRVYELASSKGGDIPYTVIREISENFIHADFEEPVVSILDHGNTIMFADQGPGIKDKEKAQLPGFTSASGEMKRYIRGVGSGLPIVREFLSITGGHLIIDDNIGHGTVITITMAHEPASASVPPAPLPVSQNYQTPQVQQSAFAPIQSQANGGAYGQAAFQAVRQQPADYHAAPQASTQQAAPAYISSAQKRISDREDSIMRLFIDSREVGQTDIKNMLGISFATSTRTLASLEEMGLIVSTPSKKRVLTNAGLEYLQDIYGTRAGTQ